MVKDKNIISPLWGRTLLCMDRHSFIPSFPWFNMPSNTISLGKSHFLMTPPLVDISSVKIMQAGITKTGKLFYRF